MGFMTRKFALYMICLVVLVCIAFSAVASAEIVVGVKPGDWIEYNVTITGEVPKQHDVTWCRFDVKAVDGKNVYVDVTWKYSDGSNETVSETIKLDTGHIGEAFIIPANSDKGDTFSSYEGNITISGVEEKTCAGATRSVVYANTPETMFYWDMSTGFLVEANSSSSKFTMFTKAEETNMWQTQIFGLDQTVFIALVVVVIVATLAIFLIRKLRKQSVPLS
jgi:hypothetical protein